LEKGDEGGFYGALQMNLLYATTDIFAHPHPNPLPDGEGECLFPSLSRGRVRVGMGIRSYL